MNDGNKMIWGLIGGLLVGSLMKKGSRNQAKGPVLALAFLNRYTAAPVVSALEESADRAQLVAMVAGKMGWNEATLARLQQKNSEFRRMVELARAFYESRYLALSPEKTGAEMAAGHRRLSQQAAKELKELIHNIPMERLGPLIAGLFGMDKLVQTLNECTRSQQEEKKGYLTIQFLSDQESFQRFIRAMTYLVQGTSPGSQPVHINRTFYSSLVLPNGMRLSDVERDQKVERILFVTEEGQPDIPSFNAIPIMTTITSNAGRVKAIAGHVDTLRWRDKTVGKIAQAAGDAIKKTLNVLAPNILHLSATNYRLLSGKQFALDKGGEIFKHSSRSPLVTGERQLMMLEKPIPITPSGSFMSPPGVGQQLVGMILGSACGLRLNGGGFDSKLTHEKIKAELNHPDHVSLLKKHDFKFHGLLMEQQFIRSPDFEFMHDAENLARKKDKNIQMMLSRLRKKNVDIGNYELVFYFSMDGRSGSIVSTLKMRPENGWFFLDGGVDSLGIVEHLRFNPSYIQNVVDTRTPMFYYAPKHVSATFDDLSGNYYINPVIATFFVKCIQSIGAVQTRQTCESELLPHYRLFAGIRSGAERKRVKEKREKEKKRKTKTIPPPRWQKPKPAPPPVQQKPVVHQIAEQIVEQGFTPVLEQKYEPAEEYLVIGDNIEDSIKIYEQNFQSTTFPQNRILNVMKEDLSNLYQDVFFDVKPWNQFSQMVDVKDISSHIKTLSEEITQNIGLLDLSWPEIPSTVLNIGMEMSHPADLIRTMGGPALFKVKSGPKKDRIVLSGVKPATLESILIAEYREQTLVDFVVLQPDVRIEHGGGRVQKNFQNLCIVYRLSVNTRTGKGQWEIAIQDELSKQLLQVWAAITSIFRNRDSAGRTSNPALRTGGVPKNPGHKKNFVDPNKTIVRQTDVFLNPESDGLYEVVYVPPQTHFTQESKRGGVGPSYRPDTLGHRYKRQDRLSDKQEYDIEQGRVPVRPHYMNRSGRKYIPVSNQGTPAEQDYFWHSGEDRPWTYYKVRTAIKGFQRREDGKLEAFSLPYIVFTRVIESE